MCLPSDIPPTIVKLKTYFFYIVGSISLLVNTATIYIIAWKGSALTREIRNFAIFQQLSCTFSNLFLTILFVPFYYPRAGAGYCVGLLCMVLPFEIVRIVDTALSMIMLSAFGIMIVARHQLLIEDGSALKMRLSMKYASYMLICLAPHLLTLSSILSSQSPRRIQHFILDTQYPQIKWRERGLNWYVFNGAGHTALQDFTTYGFLPFVAVICAFVVLPFVHMLWIVLRSRKNMGREQRKKSLHIRYSQTIIMQSLTLLICVGLPFAPALVAGMRYSIYADTQVSIVLGEMAFACATLFNSMVIVLRNRAYTNAIRRISGMGLQSK